MDRTPKIASIEPLGAQVYAVRMQCSNPACLPDVFTVSLSASGWNGTCTCPAFVGCCSFLLERNPNRRQRCDHIVACRMWFMEHEAPKLIEESKPKIVVLPDYESPTISTDCLP